MKSKIINRVRERNRRTKAYSALEIDQAIERMWENAKVTFVPSEKGGIGGFTQKRKRWYQFWK